jgi:subtilisin family serine protease
MALSQPLINGFLVRSVLISTLLLTLVTHASFAAPSGSDSYTSDRIIVRYKQRMSAQSNQNILVSKNLTEDAKYPRLGITVLKTDKPSSIPKLVEELNALDSIEYAEPDYKLHIATTPNDSRFSELSGLHNATDADIDAPEAWDIGTGDSDIIVAIIDTGVDYNHPDLIDNIWTNPGEIPGDNIDNDNNGYIDDIHGINAINYTGDPMDDGEHGTHVAGTIGAKGNNNLGVTGINWDVSIIGLKFLDSQGNGRASDAIRCLDYALTLKQSGINIRVTNSSWSGDDYNQSLYDAFQALGNAGVLNAVAAGNHNNNNDTSPRYPSSFNLDTIISVGATNNDDESTSFSNRGINSVDLGAPGVRILSTIPGGGYAYLSGTSMATPHVAGAAALLASLNPNMSPTDLKNTLMATVDPKPALDNYWVSGGRLNLFNALSRQQTCETNYSLPDNQWMQISLPCNPGSRNKVSDVFNNVPGTYDNDWVVYRYDAINNLYVNLGVNGILEQGTGYWIIQKSGNSIDLSMPQGSMPTGTATFDILLTTKDNGTQWNMIGFPYDTTETLSTATVSAKSGACSPNCDLDTAKSADIVHNQLWHYDGSAYLQVNTPDNLTPWAGYWAPTLSNASSAAPIKLVVPKP